MRRQGLTVLSALILGAALSSCGGSNPVSEAVSNVAAQTQAASGFDATIKAAQLRPLKLS